MIYGARGDNDILLSAITAIKLKEPGVFPGYIQFVYMGSQDRKAGFGHYLDPERSLAADENAVMFGRDSYSDFLRLKHEAERRMTADQPGQPSSNQTDALNALEKLADLRNQGVITEAEFEAKKRQLLGL